MCPCLKTLSILACCSWLVWLLREQTHLSTTCTSFFFFLGLCLLGLHLRSVVWRVPPAAPWLPLSRWLLPRVSSDPAWRLQKPKCEITLNKPIKKQPFQHTHPSVCRIQPDWILHCYTINHSIAVATSFWHQIIQHLIQILTCSKAVDSWVQVTYPGHESTFSLTWWRTHQGGYDNTSICSSVSCSLKTSVPTQKSTQEKP